MKGIHPLKYNAGIDDKGITLTSHARGFCSDGSRITSGKPQEPPQAG